MMRITTINTQRQEKHPTKHLLIFKNKLAKNKYQTSINQNLGVSPANSGVREGVFFFSRGPFIKNEQGGGYPQCPMPQLPKATKITKAKTTGWNSPEGPRHNLHKVVHRKHMARKPSPCETNWWRFCRPDGRLKTRPKRRFVPKKKRCNQEEKPRKMPFLLWIYVHMVVSFVRKWYPFFFLQNGFVPQGSTREVLVLGNPGVKAELIHSGRII